MGRAALGGLLAWGLALGAVPAAAAAETLTWDECVREAARQNPDVAAAREAVAKARADYGGSYSPLLPQLSATTSYTDSKSTSHSREASAALSATQSLFSGGRRVAGVQKSRAALDAAEAALAVATAQASADLKTAYAQLLYAQEEAELTEAIASRRQENTRLIELRFEGGREPKGSFLRSRALYHQADFEVAQAARAFHVAQRRLARVLGRHDTDLLVASALRPSPPGPPPDFRALALEAPVRRQAAADARAADATVAVTRSELFPDISATGSLGRAGHEFTFNRTDWSAGLAVSYPFWPGGQQVFDLQGAKASARNAQQTLRSTEDQAAFTLESAFRTYQDAVEHVALQREFLDAADARAEIARGQYTLGLLSFQDWDTIESDLITNQKGMLTISRDAVEAEAEWERVQGKGAIS